MKRVLLMLAVVFTSMGIQAQTNLDVSTDRTLSITFPTSVSHIDLGSPSLDARLVGPGSKVVLLKGVEAGFRETNLTVVTADNEVYSFNVAYCAAPKRDVVVVAFKPSAPQHYAASIMNSGRRLPGVFDAGQGMYAVLKGIYVRDTLLYFHLKIDNTTALGYEVDAIRFVLVNNRSTKRTAQQELTLSPVSFHGNHCEVLPYGNTTLVGVLPKFTLAGKRRLHIEILERGGERNLKLKVPARKLSQAAALPSLQ